MGSILNLQNISAGYQKRNNILENIDLVVNEEEVLAVIGQNGSGKSTLAKAIMKLTPYLGGSITFRDKNISHLQTEARRDLGIGFFMQGGRVFPSMTVNENLCAASTGLSKLDFKQNRNKMNEFFCDSRDGFNLLDNHFLTKGASLLSGGEKHKLALSMILMKQPKLLILDEPSAGLMPAAVKQMYSSLDRIRKEEAISIILIEQNVIEAIKFSDRVIKLGNKTILDEEVSSNLDTQEKIEKFFMLL